MVGIDSRRPASGESGEYAVGSPAPPPNDGRIADIHHWRKIERIAETLRRRGYTDIRVSQEQVRDGRITGANKPDIQAVSPGGQRTVVEVDSDSGESDRHQRVITTVDPTVRFVGVVFDGPTGRNTELRVYDPRRRTTRSVGVGAARQLTPAAAAGGPFGAPRPPGAPAAPRRAALPPWARPQFRPRPAGSGAASRLPRRRPGGGLMPAGRWRQRESEW